MPWKVLPEQLVYNSMQPEARSHDLELQQKPQVSYAENMCLIKMETDAALFFFFFFPPPWKEDTNSNANIAASKKLYITNTGKCYELASAGE